MAGKAVNVGTASIAVSGDTSVLLKTMRADITKMTAASIKGITESMEKLLKEMSKSSDVVSKKLIDDNARTEKKKTADIKAEQAKRSANEDAARKSAEASEKATHTRSMARTKELSGALTQAFRKRSVGELTGGLSKAMSGIVKVTQESFSGIKAAGMKVVDPIKARLSEAFSNMRSTAISLPANSFSKLKALVSRPVTEGIQVGLKDRAIDAAARESGSRMGNGLKAALMAAAPLAAIGIAGSKFKDALGQGLTQASDLNETLNKSASIWGSNANAIEQWAATASTSFGTTKQAALENIASYGDMFLQLGIGGEEAMNMSKELMQRATDIGSFSNMSTEDVNERIMAGMRGEFDSLQKIVPRISAELVKDRMAAMKLADNSANRAKAVSAIILEDTRRAAGDFSKTAKGYANASKVARANVEELKARLGKMFLPFAEGMLDTFNTKLVPAMHLFFDRLEKGDGGVKRITDAFKTFTKVALFAKDVVVDIYKVLNTGAPGNNGIFVQLGMNENSPVIVFLSSIHKLIVSVGKQMDQLRDKVNGLAKAFSTDWKTGNGFAGAMRGNIDLMYELFNYIKDPSNANWDVLNGAGITGDSPIIGFLDKVKEKAGAVKSSLSDMAKTVNWESIKGLAGQGLDAAKSVVQDFRVAQPGTIGGSTREQFDSALDAGNKVRSQFQDDIIPSIKKMWSSIFDNINFSEVYQAISTLKTKFMNSVNWEEIGRIIGNVLKLVTDLVAAVGENVLPTIGRIWDTLQPIFENIVEKIGGIINKLSPLINYMLESIQTKLLPEIGRLWRDVLGPIFETVAKLAASIWAVISPLIDGLMFILIPLLKAVWDSSVAAFNGLVDVLTWAWGLASPIIGAIIDAFNGIGSALSVLPDTVRAIFTSVQSALRDASNVVIGAINEMFIDKLNWLIEKVTGKANYISQIPLIGTDSNENNPNFNSAQQFHERRGLATGGILPGFSPGYDNHHFFSPTAGFLSLSGGEAILRPEATLALGSGTINAMNAAARSGGVQGVLAMLSEMVPHQRYADGGVYDGDVKIDDGFTLNPFEHLKRAAQRLFAFIRKLIPEPIVSMVQESLKQLVDRLPLGGNLASSIDEAAIYDRGGVLPPTPRGQAMVVANRSGRDEYVFTQPQLLERDRLISNSVGSGHTSTVNLHAQKVDSRNLSKVLQEAERRVQTRGKHGRR